ncbi:Sugar-specific transcriptional regulator TrmB [Streptomyces wuyuanensis]|uniref:Sugar-specific transcriptional regulator TrmB n=1 Tax=Streptomyces wuyuanensis TaxID=1196353 RepID=A0A1G9MXK9_9ACTN|nr:helix-turn-helix domain-containing protein [Streptomyces wuyuanensis]SDL79036.1 Sugar-specific transcriptional regulator TrmB [Streptomyces wuyuanensis]
MLGAIGLDARQESAYRALVALGAAEVTDLAHRLALPEADTERALRLLEHQGLAAQSSARADRWVAAPPGVALGALLTQHRHDLEQAELAAALLAREYRAEATELPVHDLVEVVTGASAVAHRFLQLQLGASEEVCALVTGKPMVVSGIENDAEERAAQRGVAYRVVIEREVLTLPTGLVEVSASLGRDEQVRVVDRVPTKLVVADRTLAMVPLTGRGSEPAALVVHASGLLESLTGLFEAVWREALPLRLGGRGEVAEDGPAGPDAADLEILSLLLAGMTDASVAKQLDLGLRTVQRRVKGLMELAGVTTRLQLGWHAYEKGWVARSADERRAGGPATAPATAPGTAPVAGPAPERTGPAAGPAPEGGGAGFATAATASADGPPVPGPAADAG